MSVLDPVDHLASGIGAGDILVVDDNVANLVAMEAALGILGCPVVRAQSGEEALRILLERDFALILMDVQMPSLGGFETAELIRERPRTRHTPIIFVTAHGRDEQDVLAAYRLGAVDFLFKPVMAEILRSKASVFVELQRRAAQVARQSEQLRQHERREHELMLEEERRRWDEEALRRKMVEMQEIDRRKDEFLAVLGHELRNPLSAIVVGSELLGRKLTGVAGLDGSVLAIRERIDRQAQYLRRLIDDLLDLARINTGRIELKRTMTSIQGVIEQAVATNLPVIEAARHVVDVKVPPEPILLWADPVRLVQVVANLLNNAARYTPHGGSIRIACSAIDDGKQVAIEVVDNGSGIPADLLPHIFDSYIRGSSDGATQGLGLGLTIVKRMVTLHGGTVTAASLGEGQGSTFTIVLPCTAEPAVADARRTPTGDPVSRVRPAMPLEAVVAAAAQPAVESPGGLSIVLVEDNDDIRESMKEILVGLGHAVEEADNGRSGADLILRTAPDVAIVDIGLPVLDGYQLAACVRSRLGSDRVRLVAMTGYGQETDRRRAREAGFDAHLVKPPDIDEVIQLLSAKES